MRLDRSTVDFSQGARSKFVEGDEAVLHQTSPHPEPSGHRFPRESTSTDKIRRCQALSSEIPAECPLSYQFFCEEYEYDPTRLDGA